MSSMATPMGMPTSSSVSMAAMQKAPSSSLSAAKGSEDIHHGELTMTARKAIPKSSGLKAFFSSREASSPMMSATKETTAARVPSAANRTKIYSGMWRS